MNTINRLSVLALMAIVAFFGIACEKHMPGEPNNSTNTPAYRVPKILSFYAEPDSVGKGKSANLFWLTENGTAAMIETSPKIFPNGETVPVSGSYLVWPDTTTIYMLILAGKSSSGIDTTVADTVTIKVGKPSDPPPPVKILKIKGFWADDDSLTTSGPVTVHWEVENATYTDISGTQVESAGFRTFTLSESVTYILTTRGKGSANQDSTATDTLAIYVATPPQPPVQKYHDVEIYLNGVRGDLGGIESFLGSSITDDGTGRPRTIAVWSNKFDSLAVEVDGELLFGNANAPHVARLSVADAPAEWHRSWTKSIEDAKAGKIYQASYWHEVPFIRNIEIFIDGVRGDLAGIESFLGSSITDDGTGRPRTIAVWSNDWTKLSVEEAGQHLFGDQNAPFKVVLTYAPAPAGHHISSQNSLEDAQTNKIRWISYYRE